MATYAAPALPPSLTESQLDDVEAVVSCVGAFGSDEYMARVNGDANVRAVSAALRRRVSRFVFISAIRTDLPSFVLRGYFEGKRRGEEAVLDAFGGNGTVLRPSFVFGDRAVSPALTLPLGWVGRPVQALLDLPGLRDLHRLPGLRGLLLPPVAVEDVGLVAAAAALGSLPASETVLEVPAIRELAR